MEVSCCNKCFETIARKNTLAAKLWLDLCSYYSQYLGLLGLKEGNVPHLVPAFRHLESMRYISTVDGPEAVHIRLEGYEPVPVHAKIVETFCIDRKKHGNDWE